MSKRARFIGFVAAALVAVMAPAVTAGPAGAITAQHSRFTALPVPGSGCPLGEVWAGPTSTDDSLVVFFMQPKGANPIYAQTTLTAAWLNVTTWRGGTFQMTHWDASAHNVGYPNNASWGGAVSSVGAGRVLVAVHGTAANSVQTCHYLLGTTALTYA